MTVTAGNYYRIDGKIKQAVSEPEWSEKAFAEELAANRFRLAEAKERLAAIPVKTKPDAETLLFWQAVNQAERERAQAEVDQLAVLIDKMEKVSIAEVPK